MNKPSKNALQWQRFGRHASRDFLMTVPKGHSHEQLHQRPSELQVAHLRDQHPELLVGDAVASKAQKRLHMVSRFAVLVLKTEGGQEIAPLRQLETAAEAVEQLAATHDGTWGLLYHNLMALFLPDTDPEQCRAMAFDIQTRLAAEDFGPVSGGIAQYPTDSYQRHQVLDNAIKALYHAGFCGHRAIVVFDAVSLNISGDRLYNQGDIAGAISEFSIAARLDPANANVFNSLGVAYGVMGNYPKALEAFRIAIRLDTGEGIAYYN